MEGELPPSVLSTGYNLATDRWEMRLPEGLLSWEANDRSVVGSLLADQLIQQYGRALAIALQRNRFYDDSWRKQGWMGNLNRILTKADRLRAMLWREAPMQDSSEPVEDTYLDLINLAAMANINHREGNTWGPDR